VSGVRRVLWCGVVWLQSLSLVPANSNACTHQSVSDLRRPSGIEVGSHRCARTIRNSLSEK
jgi:hypothetical protein